MRRCERKKFTSMFVAGFVAGFAVGFAPDFDVGFSLCGIVTGDGICCRVFVGAGVSGITIPLLQPNLPQYYTTEYQVQQCSYLARAEHTQMDSVTSLRLELPEQRLE